MTNLFNQIRPFSSFRKTSSFKKNRGRVLNSKRLLLEQLEDRRLLTTIFELSSLLPSGGGDGSTGFVLNGPNAGDQIGRAVALAGDINGDNIDDFIIGAAKATAGGDELAGKTFVVFGHTDPVSPTMNLSLLNGSNGFVIEGIAAFDQSGHSVSSAGDVNGDGIDDLLIGAPLAKAGSEEFAGQSYVIFGHSAPFLPTLDLSTLNGINGFTIQGSAADDVSGQAIAAAGDFNGDGFDDILIGAEGASPDGKAFAGESYLLYGKGTGYTSSFSLSSIDGNNGFVIRGARAGDSSGFAVSSAGDFNRDGLDDLLIGARNADPNGQEDAGESYIVFGKESGVGTSIELSTLSANQGLILAGVNGNDFSGFSVASAGDVNGDGFGDVLIGAHQAGANNVGNSYVVFGTDDVTSNHINLSSLDGINGFSIRGSADDEHFGFAVNHAGDVNDDGYSDLIIGVRTANPNASAGQSYLVFGRPGGFSREINTASLDDHYGVVIQGIATGDRAGQAVSSAGDFNNDGVSDLVISAPAASPNNPGQVYLIFGGSFGGSVPMAQDDMTETIRNTPVSIDVLANDTDTDGSLVPGTVSVLAGPTSGSLEVDPLTGNVTYTPEQDFFGTDTFLYSVEDNDGITSNLAFVTVNVDERTSVFQNAPNRYDVDDNGIVNSLDLLKIIRDVNMNGNRALPPQLPGEAPLFIDINGDNIVNPLDFVLLVAELNRLSAEGESESTAEGEPRQIFHHEELDTKPVDAPGAASYVNDSFIDTQIMETLFSQEENIDLMSIDSTIRGDDLRPERSIASDLTLSPKLPQFQPETSSRETLKRNSILAEISSDIEIEWGISGDYAE